MRIVGISGSPVKAGNLDTFLYHIMTLAQEKGLDIETIHLSHIQAFVTLDMIPAAIHSCVSPLGASALASRHGAGVFDPAGHVGIQEDIDGLKSARALLDRAVEPAELIHPSGRASV